MYEEAVPVVPPPRPRIWPWLLLLLVLLAAGLAALYVLSRDDDDPGTTTTATSVSRVDVPNVVGQRADRAAARLVDADLKSELRRSLSKKPSGVVLQQDPGAAASVPAGSTVVLTVSRGADTVAVPALTGLPLNQALAKLTDAGLKGTAKRVFAAEPAGQVTAQEPGGGSELKKGGTVVLTVSKGKQPVDVPDVVGQTRDAATTALEQAGLKAGVREVPSAEPNGSVVAQSPKAGERAPKGSTVQINVSKGQSSTGTTTTATTTTTTTGTSGAALVTVPDVVDLKLAQATQRLASAGLKTDPKRVPSRKPLGTVLAQFPAAGETAKRGGSVRVNVSRGPSTKAVPDVLGDDEVTARDRLENAGFRVKVVEQDTTDPAEDTLVIDQDPPGGERRRPGAEVTIVVGVLTDSG